MIRHLVAGFFLATALVAQDDCTLGSLVAPDAEPFDWFGDAVALDGGTVVIGARFDDDLGLNSGSAYVFVESGGVWSFEAKLTAADGEEGDFFGDSVAISGDTIVVGARYEDSGATDAGAAYVFDRAGGVWSQTDKLLAGDASTDDRLGARVDIDGDRVVAASETNDQGAPDAGAVYVFDRAGGLWSESAKLTSTTPSANDFLGASVALSGDVVVAGANGNDAAAPDGGSVHVFAFDGTTWSEADVLVAENPRESARFGASVDVEGPTIVVGAPLEDDGVVDSGSVYVYELVGSTLTFAAKLRLPFPSLFDEFGSAVALAGSSIIVGVPKDDTQGVNAGRLYQFVSDTGSWEFHDAVFDGGGGAGDQLGRSVAATNLLLVAGATFDDTAGFDAGQVRTFHHPGTRRDYGTGLAGSNGIPELATQRGCLRNEQMDALDISNGPSSGFGLLVVGGSEVAVPFAGGFLLVGLLPSGVFLNFPVATDANGDFSMPFMVTSDFIDRSLHMQVGFLDAAAPNNVSLSAGLQLAFR